MNYCACPVPLETSNPRTKGSCRKCGHILNPEWVSDDRQVAEFFARLTPVLGDEPTFPHFRELCQRRERAGRDYFGFRYLDRDNVAEGAEEAADGANYAYFEMLQARRLGLDPEEDLLLSAAQHFALAYASLAAAQHKHRGAP